MTETPLIPRKYWAIAFGIVALMAAIELAMGRHPICTCGTVKLFVATVHGPDNSQHIADWYTPSHIIHGLLFYLLGWLVLRGTPAGQRLLLAVSIEAVLERAIEKTFGLDVPVIVRSKAEWAKYPALNPFPAVAKDTPAKLHILLSKRPPAKDAADVIQARAKAGEQIRQAGDALWLHYPEGAGTSKLTPSLIDRATGSPGTARNYNTLLKLKEMLEA